MYDPEIAEVIRSRQQLSLHNTRVHELRILQDPEESRALARQEKSRGAKWPLDPPPVIELILNDNDPSRTYLHSPFWICRADLEIINTAAKGTNPALLTGTCVSSLHKVKLTDSKERGLFIFGDLNIKHAGSYRLRFSLFEMRKLGGSDVIERLAAITSRDFKVVTSKANHHIRESTGLSKQLCEAGIKLRIRKETSNKRRQNPFEWSSNRAHIFGSTMLPSNMLPNQSRMMSGQRYNSGAPGVDITSRLSISSGSVLGIKSAVDKDLDSSKPNTGAGSFESWRMSQPNYVGQLPPYHHPSLPAYSMPPTAVSHYEFRHSLPATTSGFEYPPAHAATTSSYDYQPPVTATSSGFEYQAAMAPTASNYELQQGHPAYDNSTHHIPRHTMPPTPYTINSNNHTQSDHNDMRGSDQSYSMSNNGYGQMQTNGAITSFDHHDQLYGHQLANPFPPGPNLAPGPSDQFTYPGFRERSRSHPKPPADSEGEHFG